MGELRRHPCFDETAHRSCGRLHLPVAPRCNIQCAYCDRRFDCVHESRPGVTSKILDVDSAVRYARGYLQRHPETTVIGIAGPGEPLANPETFAVFQAIRGDVIKCVSTNGLLLPGRLTLLKECGVTALTVTFNTLRLETAERLYCPPTDCAALLRSQQEGLKAAAKAGFSVKVNTVLVPGINDRAEEVEKIAAFASKSGVRIMNLNSVIPAGRLAGSQPVSTREVCRLRKAAEKYIQQFHLCRQCRADAAGIPACEPPRT